MKGFIYTFMIIALLGLVTVLVYNNAEAPLIPVEPVATVTAPVVLDTNEIVMTLYSMRTIEGTTLHVWAVTEDSRCPANANCVWAGRVKVALNIGTAMGTSTNELELGQSVTTENKKITLTEVLPQPIAGYKIADDEYRFVFKIEDHNPAVVTPAPRPTPTPVPHQGACYVGGCSAHICSDKQDVVSTCEWREAYACYGKTSKCERQATGQCGWTQTPELTKCLSEAN